MSDDTWQRVIGGLQVISGVAGMVYGSAYGAGAGSGSMIGEGIRNLEGKESHKWMHRKGGFGQDVLTSFGLSSLAPHQEQVSRESQMGGQLGGLVGGLYGNMGGGSGASGKGGSLGSGKGGGGGLGATGASQGTYGVLASDAGPSAAQAMQNIGALGGGSSGSYGVLASDAGGQGLGLGALGQNSSGMNMNNILGLAKRTVQGGLKGYEDSQQGGSAVNIQPQIGPQHGGMMQPPPPYIAPPNMIPPHTPVDVPGGQSGQIDINRLLALLAMSGQMGGQA